MTRTAPPGYAGPSAAREPSDPFRRRFLRTAGAAVAAVGLAGCGSNTSYEFSAAPVVLPTDARAELSYETLHSEPVVVERSRTVSGVDVRVTVASHAAVYRAAAPDERGTAAGPTVGAVSTPNAGVMGRSLDSLARRSLANLLTGRTGLRRLRRAGLDRIGHARERVRWERPPTFVGGREGTCLGIETTLESYAGILGGAPLSVAFVHLTRVDADSVVSTAGVHGHDVAGAGDRSFVASGDGYLSPGAFDEAVATFATASAAFAYRR